MNWGGKWSAKVCATKSRGSAVFQTPESRRAHLVSAQVSAPTSQAVPRAARPRQLSLCPRAPLPLPAGVPPPPSFMISAASRFRILAALIPLTPFTARMLPAAPTEAPPALVARARGGGGGGGGSARVGFHSLDRLDPFHSLHALRAAADWAEAARSAPRPSPAPLRPASLPGSPLLRSAAPARLLPGGRAAGRARSRRQL